MFLVGGLDFPMTSPLPLRLPSQFENALRALLLSEIEILRTRGHGGICFGQLYSRVNAAAITLPGCPGSRELYAIYGKVCRHSKIKSFLLN